MHSCLRSLCSPSSTCCSPSAAPPVPTVAPPQPLQYLLSLLLRGPAFLPPRRPNFCCSLYVSFAPSPADLAASSWPINYNFPTLTLTLTETQTAKCKSDPSPYSAWSGGTFAQSQTLSPSSIPGSDTSNSLLTLTIGFWCHTSWSNEPDV